MVTGKNVVLRAWSEDDLTVLQSMRNNLQLQVQLMTQARGNSFDQIKEWLRARTKSADCLFFVIAGKSSGEPVGYVQVVGMDHINGTGELGICIAPDCQCKGYGGEAITLLEGYLRDVFRLRKLTLKVLRENDIAIYLYTKHGYTEVGCLREHFYTGAHYSDVVIMEKLF